MTLKELRVRKRMTQPELARAVGVAQSQICYWESGTHTPRLKVRDRLAEALEISGEELDRAIAEGRAARADKG